MPGRVVIQWDKDDCADMGLVKVDLLGLGMMAVLQDALGLVNGSRRATPIVDLAHLPPDDPAVYTMLQEADTIGIFQVESRAQMATLPRLKPRTLLRHRRRGRDHQAGTDRRPDGASLSEAAAAGSRRSSIRIRRSSRSWRGRWACRCSRSSCCGWRWWRRGSAAAKPRNCGGRSDSSGPRSGCSRSKGSCATGMARQGITGDAAETDHPLDHLVRALRLSRVACRELRADRLRQRVSSRRTIRRRSSPRCSTTSRWGSIIRRRWSRTRSATASVSRRSTCRNRTGNAGSTATAGCGSG